jgi:tripartite-type tricarboxylate transporter receptor subunit TctC
MMKKNGFKILSLLMVAVFLFAGCSNAGNDAEAAANEGEATATYPEKEVTMIVPWGAGGITDTVARTFSTAFEEALGESVTVVNMSGASGAIGTESAYAEAADGYTVLFSAETPGVFNVMGTSELNFSSFEPIMMMVQDTKLVVVPTDSPYETFEQLVADMKANPGQIKLSYSSPGASGHLQGLTLNLADIDVNMTPYGGGSDAMIACLSGEVDFTFGNYGTVKDYLESGELRALATFTEGQVEFLPDVPPMTIALPELNSIFPLYFPNCLMVKEGTPDEVKMVIREAAEKAILSETWTTFIANRNYQTLHDMTNEEIGAYWDKYTSVTSWLLYDAEAAINNPEDYQIERYNK